MNLNRAREQMTSLGRELLRALAREEELYRRYTRKLGGELIGRQWMEAQKAVQGLAHHYAGSIKHYRRLVQHTVIDHPPGRPPKRPTPARNMREIQTAAVRRKPPHYLTAPLFAVLGLRQT